MNAPRIYLDHAATGWPKQERVMRAMEQQMRSVGAAAGRGTYRSAIASGRVLEDCRNLATRLFHSPAGGCWTFAANGTAALNTAIHGVVRPGDHVVTTACEHNSVLRPLDFLAHRDSVRVDVVPCDRQGRISAEQVLERVRADTRLVAVQHGSNVTGAVAPVEQIARGMRQSAAPEALVLCDAAQTAGHLKIDVGAMEVDLLATPGHKGLGGPLGSGLLYVGPRAAEQIEPWMQGGTGSESSDPRMPRRLPDRLEAGNHNTPAIAGLAAAIETLLAADLDQIASQLSRQVGDLADAIAVLPGVRVITARQLPIVSLVFQDFAPQEVAAILDAEFGIETRAGLHCAPRIHPFLGSEEGGTLRISFGPSTPEQHLQAVVDALEEILASP